MFVVGAVTRIGVQWGETPIDRIGTNNFRFHVLDSDQYYISYNCNNGTITASYSLSEDRVRTYPTNLGLVDEAVRWIAVHNGEIFSASMAAPFVLSGKEAFKHFDSYNSKRLDYIRLFRKTLRKRWVRMIVVTAGGYWGGDYVASKLDVPCQRSKDLDWLRTVDWKAVTRAVYDHSVHEASRCVFSLGERLENSIGGSFDGLKDKYFDGHENLFTELTKPIDRSEMLRDILNFFPSPNINSFLPSEGFAIKADPVYEVGGEELKRIAFALDECQRVSAILDPSIVDG